jgi:hypothetical protein
MAPASIIAARTATPARRHLLTVFRRAELISITSAVVPFRPGSIILPSSNAPFQRAKKQTFFLTQQGSCHLSARFGRKYLAEFLSFMRDER